MSNASTRKRGIPNPLAWIGAATLGFFAEIGRLATFSAQVKAAAFSPRWYFGQIWKQFVQIGFYSLPVVGMSAIFIGAALALNIYQAAVVLAQSNSCRTSSSSASRANWAPVSPP